jgi:hypothetical protein
LQYYCHLVKTDPVKIYYYNNNNNNNNSNNNDSLPAAAMSCLSGVMSSAFTCYSESRNFTDVLTCFIHGAHGSMKVAASIPGELNF